MRENTWEGKEEKEITDGAVEPHHSQNQEEALFCQLVLPVLQPTSAGTSMPLRLLCLVPQTSSSSLPFCIFLLNHLYLFLYLLGQNKISMPNTLCFSPQCSLVLLSLVLKL